MPTLEPRGDEAERLAAAETFRKRLKDARAIVVGLGASGVAAARLLRRLGANVTGTDVAPREKLSEGARSLEAAGVRLAVGGHHQAGFGEAALVVVSPGVPKIREIVDAEARGVETIGELELATRLLPKLPAIAITGSNGKSTTTTLVGELLTAAGYRPFVGGNLGAPPSDLVDATDGKGDVDALVLEVSSYQAERMPTFRPRSASLLNASENHLDRYDSFAHYVAAKGNLFVNQAGGDISVIPSGSPMLLEQAKRGKGTIVRFGRAGDAEADITYSREAILDRARGFEIDRKSVLVAGDHNAENVCAALALVRPFNVSNDALKSVLTTFKGLPHRIAFVREVAGIRFYDDSKGTNVGAAVAAIRGLHEAKVVLIAGGRDKLGSYEPLVEAMKERGRGLVLIGEAADRIAEAAGNAVPIVRAASMKEAVEEARELAQRGDAVLLSPACSSFDMFRDYKHRGDEFVKAVVELTGA